MADPVNNSTRRNQFADITEYEPFDIARNNFDNPPFTWPAKQYTDISGNNIKIQRGYMRSLITDPRWSVTPNVKNRRLFFQFNPTVLVRSVQQTVGAMNPLLQDPAQLAQPVPGTSTFGFELLFNREKEVASGSSYPPGQAPSPNDMIILPNGDAALPSEIGVLADILVLDTITGQGISKEMIDALTKTTQNAAIDNITSREERIKQLEKDDDNKDVIAIEQADLSTLRQKLDSLSQEYTINIGNQAFLNPLPFRVMFSSLFMVEGVATSIEVQYQKFSATMVPTQCKVIINMYALYLGFAQRDTFLTKNLETAAQDAWTQQNQETALRSRLNLGIREIYIPGIKFDTDGGDARVRVKDYKITLSESLIDSLKKKEIKDLHMTVSMKLAFFPTSTSQATLNSLTSQGQVVTVNGDKVEIPIRNLKTTIDPTSQGTDGLKSPEVENLIEEELKQTSPRLFLSYLLEFVFVADGVQSTPILLPIANGVPLSTGTMVPTAYTSPPQTWTNSQSVRPLPRSGSY
jgi:hypothetical protein